MLMHNFLPQRSMEAALTLRLHPALIGGRGKGLGEAGGLRIVLACYRFFLACRGMPQKNFNCICGGGVGLCLSFVKTGTGFILASGAGLVLACLWTGFFGAWPAQTKVFFGVWLSQNGFCFGVQRHANFFHLILGTFSTLEHNEKDPFIVQKPL